MTERVLDGNAAAGALSELFALEVTAARGQCNGCGALTVLAEARLYADAPGLVVRCARCDGILLRVVQTPGRTCLDLRGYTYLEFRTG